MTSKWLLGLILLLSAVTPLLYGDTLIDERENWDAIISRFHDHLERNRRLQEDIDGFVYRGMLNFEKHSAMAEKRMRELRFLVSRESPNNVFAVAMYCKQIDDLKTFVDQRVRRVKLLRDKMYADSTRIRGQEPLLKQVTRSDLKPREFATLQSCEKDILAFSSNVFAVCDRIDKALKEGVRLQEEIDKLGQFAEEKRKMVIRQVIFARQLSFHYVIPLVGPLLEFWVADIVEWLSIQFPDDPKFWLYFLLLLLFPGLPVFLLGRPLFRRTVSAIGLSETHRNMKIFLTAWGLIILSAFFMGSKMVLGEVESTPMFQIGKMLLCSAAMLLSLSLRVGRKDLPRCLILYTPLLFQHLASIALCTMLIPYLPLILICPLLNLPVIAVTAWLLLTRRYPLPDTVFSFFTVAGSTVSLILALVGLPYIAFTIMLVWFVAVAGLESGMAITRLVNDFSAVNAHRKILTCMLFTLLVPIMWLVLVGATVYWTAGMYNAQHVLIRSLFVDLFNCRNLIRISLVDILACVVAGLILHFLISSVRHLVRLVYGDKAETGLIPSFLILGSYLSWSFYVIVVLLVFDFHYSSILVIMGGMSMGIGFGLKDILGNFISGISLLVGQQLRPGDIIEYNGTWGKIRKINARATVVETGDLAVITFPNATVMSKDFRNWTSNNNMMIKEVKVSVGHGSDIAKVKELLLQTAHETDGVMKNPPPLVTLSELTDNTMQFTLSVAVQVAIRSEVPGRIRERVEQALRDNGINIGTTKKSDS